MKILVLADEESKSLWDYYTPDKLEGVELIIACGDLRAEYLEFLVTMTNLPLFYVPGNHDAKYESNPPDGCVNIDGKIMEYKGIRIIGFGGSMRYKKGPYQYSEKEMRHRIWKMKRQIYHKSGIDILVTHAPAKGYGDMEDRAHVGFACFDELMKRFHPLYMIHGHVHKSYKHKFKRVMEHPSGTKIINAFDKYILDYDETKKNTMPELEMVWKMIFAFV